MNPTTSGHLSGDLNYTPVTTPMGGQGPVSIPDVVLSNVLTDALAHHEASDAPSLVRHADPDGTERWLDFERAGQVCAAALELVGQDTRGRLLFAVPVPTTAGTVAPVDASGAPAGARSVLDDPLDRVFALIRHDLATSSNTIADTLDVETERNLIGRVMGLARQVMPVDANRKNSIESWMRELGVEAPSFPADLHKLTPAQLLRVLDKLALVGAAMHRNDPGAAS